MQAICFLLTYSSSSKLILKAKRDNDREEEEEETIKGHVSRFGTSQQGVTKGTDVILKRTQKQILSNSQKWAPFQMLASGTI